MRKQYAVTYEARKRGSIGVFQYETRYTMADREGEVFGVVQSVLHREGFETRFPAQVKDSDTGADLTESARLDYLAMIQGGGR